MSDNQFDKFLREKLQEHSSPVPENMWERIRDKKDKDRKVFFLLRWYSVAAILILFSLSGYFILNNKPTVKKEIEESESQNKQITPSQKDNTANTVTRNKTQPTEEVNAVLPNNSITRDGKKSLKGNVVTNTITKKEEGADESITPAILQANKESNKAFTESTPSSIKSSTSSINEEPIILKEQQSVTSLNNKMNAVENNAYEKEKKETAKNKKKRDINQGLFIEAYASPELAWKTTKGSFNATAFTNQAAFSSYIEQKKNAEKFVTSFSAGVRIIKPVSKHLFLKTGLQYTQLNEKFSYQYSSSRIVSVLTTRYINYSGNFVSVPATANYMQIGFQKKTTSNHYRSISVPLLISYDKGNDNFNLGFTGGAVINIASWYDGKMLNASLNPVPVKADSTYKRNSGIGLYFGINAIKKINANWQLFAEPHIQYNLSNITTNNAPVKERLHNAGISLGVRYNLLKQGSNNK